MRDAPRVAAPIRRHLDPGRTFGFALALLLLAIPTLVRAAAGETQASSAATSSETFLQSRLQRSSGTLTAAEFLNLCRSASTDKAVYCEAYIESTLAFWKYVTTCKSPTRADQAFCAGANASGDKLSDLLKSCNDCDASKLPADAAERRNAGHRFLQRMRRFYAEAATALGFCKPDQLHDANWCAGYNTQTQSEIASLGVAYRVPDIGPRIFGLGDATNDAKAALWVSKEFHHWAPCAARTLTPEEAKATLLRFAAEYPEQQRGPYAIELMAKAMFYGYCPGPALGHVRPNRELCLEWDTYDGTFGARNTCDRAVTIRFLLQHQQHAIEQEAAPGKVFSTGMSRQQLDSGWWMFTACGLGEVSSVDLAAQNRDAIADSLYSCEPAAEEKAE